MITDSYNRVGFVIFFLVIFLVSGCATVPMDAPEKDQLSKTFTTQPDKASLYIYRNEVFGAAIPMSVFVNGKNIGQTASKTYFHLNLLPGEYDIDSTAENACALSLSLEPSKNYFVWQEIKMGMWMARCALHHITDEEKGRSGVLESKLIKNQVDENEILPVGASSSDSIPNKIRELDKLRKDGLITDDEFENKKRELLEQL